MTVAPSDRTPMVSASIVFGGSGTTPGAAPKRVLLIGSMIPAAGITTTMNLAASGTEVVTTAGGTATLDRATQVRSPDHAASVNGRGAELHLGAVTAFAQFRGAEVWTAAVTPGAGAAASCVLTPTISGLTAGTLRVTVGGESVDLAITASDTVATIGLALARAINGRRDWPVTAVNVFSTGVVTVTAKHLGPRSNAISLRLALLTDAATVEMVGAAATAFGLTITPSVGAVDGGVYRLAGGTLDDSVAALLTALGSTKFDRVCFAAYRVSGTISANLGRINDALIAQDAAAMFDQQAVFGSVLGPAESITDVATLNGARCSYPESPGSDELPLQVAAAVAVGRLFGDGDLGGAIEGETASPRGPACNLNGLELALKAPRDPADVLDAGEVRGALAHGVSPLVPSGLRPGRMALVASIVTRCLAGGVPDYSVYKTKDVTVADYARASVLAELGRRYRGFNLVADTASGAPSRVPRTTNPSTVRALIYALCKKLERDGVLTDVDRTAAQITVVRNGVNPARVDFTFPSIPPSDFDQQIGVVYQQQPTEEG